MSNARQLPLREKFTNAERLTRELIDHLDQGFQTRVHELRRMARKDEADGVTDKTVRAHCTRLFESHKFSSKLTAELDELLDGILTEMEPMIYG